MDQKLKRYERYAWAVSFAVAVLLVLATLSILFVGLDENDVESSTGVTVAEIAAFDPDVVEYMERLERLLGVTGAAAAGLAAAFIWVSAKRGSARNEWYAVWLFPAMLLGDSVVFFAADGAGLGTFYAVAGIVVAITHALSFKRFAQSASSTVLTTA